MAEAERLMIEPLQDIGLGDAGQYGPKAAMLGELVAAGCRVPDGFAVGAACFDAFLAANGFGHRPVEYAAWSAEIREAVQGYAFADAFVAAVSLRVERLLAESPGHRLIARTSALCEDRHSSSLAGVFRSFGDLSSSAQVLEAIRGCYLSVFADSVISRYAEGRIAAADLRAGVVVQRYVKGDLSGVTFTADATTMDPLTLRISAVSGPCSGLTDGSAPAATYVCDKASGAVKAVLGGPVTLGRELLGRLVDSARHIERLARCHQDIEWTVAGDGLYILQARPIAGFRHRDDPAAWTIPGHPQGARQWRLHSDRCLPPLVGELVAKCTDAAGDGAWRYGMHWDSVESAVVHGYLYESSREIPGAKERLDAYLCALDEQFDRGTGEFDEHIRPELAALVQAMEQRYVGVDLTPASLLCYLDEAERFLLRAATLHWRATTSEWYLGHFYRKRIETLYDQLSAQDLVDMAYGKSMMIAEREQLYEIAASVCASQALSALFAQYPFDRIAAARLERATASEARDLLARLHAYGRRYGWHCGDPEDGQLYRGGDVPLSECVGRVRRCLGVDIEAYRRNVAAIQSRAAELREQGHRRCSSAAELASFETALRAGEKAFLAGDDHTYFICAKRYVFVGDALSRSGDALAERGLVDAPDDIRFLSLAEVRACLEHGVAVRDRVSARRAEYAAWSLLLPPRTLGAAAAPSADVGGTRAEEAGQGATEVIVRGESGTRANARGRIHVGFPAGPVDDALILLLEHGHEGDLTTVLGCVRGLILKMGTPACHMGIIARELGIPAIYGVGESAAALADGDQVEIRGETGQVVRLARAAS